MHCYVFLSNVFQFNTHHLLYKLKSHLSVSLSVHLHFWHAENSAVSASIEMGLARMKAVSLNITEFIFTSLQNPLFINTSA